jgi:hypothetical protein
MVPKLTAHTIYGVPPPFKPLQVVFVKYHREKCADETVGLVGRVQGAGGKR